ncbi:MAG: PspC domain-containing protein, partial [Actinomycetes bacterium]
MTENTDTTYPGPQPTAGQGQYPPPPPPASDQLRPPWRRSRDDRVVAGVCAGTARTLGIDPVVIRVLVVVFTLFGGVGIVLYLVGWLFIPEDGATTTEGERLLAEARVPGSSARTAAVIAVAVLALAVIFNAFGGFYLSGPLFVAGVVILVVWLVRQDRSSAPRAGQVQYPNSPEASTAFASTQTPATDTSATTPGYAYGGYGSYPAVASPAVPPPPFVPPTPRPRSYLGAITLSVAIVVAGILASLSVTGAVSIPAVVVLAAPLAILGIGLVIGAFAGRALWLIALALPLLLVTSVVAVVPANLPSSWSAGVGERTWRPVTLAQAQNGYQLSVGDAELDLTALPVTPESLTRVKAEVGVGQL